MSLHIYRPPSCGERRRAQKVHRQFGLTGLLLVVSLNSFEDHRTLVNDSMRGFARRHPSMSLIPSLKVGFDAAHE